MSYDRRLEQVCTHLVVEEALFLGEDRRTIRPLRPISSIRSVSVRYNGLVGVPAEGLYVPARAKGALPGPFDIRSGSNDTLILQVDDLPIQTIVAPSGNQISPENLAKALSSLTEGVAFEVSSRRQIQLQTHSRGPGAVLRILSGSTLAASLGLVVGKVYTGQQVLSRWGLVEDPNTLSDRPTRLIVFDDLVTGSGDFFEINYSTIREECRRCGGLGVENDWRYDRRGQIETVENFELLLQEATKVIYTEKGSNPFHVWYGTLLTQSIGKKLSDLGLLQNMIISDVREAFNRWQSIKRQQEDAGQFVSDEEYPARLLLSNVDRDPNDPTVIYVNAVVQSRSDRPPLRISRGLKLPGPLDLLGSTAQDELFRDVKAQGLQSFR